MGGCPRNANSPRNAIQPRSQQPQHRSPDQEAKIVGLPTAPAWIRKVTLKSPSRTPQTRQTLRQALNAKATTKGAERRNSGTRFRSLLANLYVLDNVCRCQGLVMHAQSCLQIGVQSGLCPCSLACILDSCPLQKLFNRCACASLYRCQDLVMHTQSCLQIGVRSGLCPCSLACILDSCPLQKLFNRCA